jgi:signal transduction histidine kinase
VRENAHCVQRPGGQTIVLIVCEDITDRKQIEEELMTSRERLRALSSYLYSIQEKERTAIARDVHDEFGQVLTSLKMDLTLLERRIKTAKDAVDPSTLLPTIACMKKTIDATIDQLTRLITELRPMVFPNLLMAMEWQIEEFQKRTGLEVDFHVGVDAIPLPHDHTIAVFRIFQESLTNIARHAQASRVQVNIYENPPNLFINITDDGVGVAPEKLADTKTFGILGMRERALLFGGEVEILGAPGNGTTVRICIPRRPGDD